MTLNPEMFFSNWKVEIFVISVQLIYLYMSS